MNSIRSGLTAATEVLKADRNDDDADDEEEKEDRRSGDRALGSCARHDDYKGEIAFDELDENMDESLANLALLIS